MIRFLLAVYIYIKVVNTTIISNGFLMTLSDKNDPSEISSRKCLISETLSQIPTVKSISCTEISLENSAARWYWFRDGTIRTKDNFCLTRSQSTTSGTPPTLRIPAYLEQCSKNRPYRQQQWKNNAGYFLPSDEKNNVTDNIVNLFEWSPTTLIAEPMSLLDKFNHQRPVDEHSMRFIESRRFIPDDPEGTF
jgi:hypothetical protein